MCFYDQHRYSCGGWEWGQFREQCSRNLRPGKTCGLHLVMQTIAIGVKCDRCDQIAAMKLYRATESDRIRQWRQDGLLKNASVRRLYNAFEVLDSETSALISRRQTESLSLRRMVNQTIGTHGPRHKGEDSFLTLCETDQSVNATPDLGTEAHAKGHPEYRSISSSLADEASHSESAVAEIPLQTPTKVDENPGQDWAVEHNEHTLGPSLDTDLEIVRSIDDAEDNAAVSALAMSASYVQLTDYKCKQIQKNIIDPVLKDITFKDIHPLVRENPYRVACGQTSSLWKFGKLEKHLIRRYPNYPPTQTSYLECRKALLQYSRLIVEHFDHGDQRRPQDIAYPQHIHHFREHVRHYAAQLADSRQAMAPSGIAWTDEKALKPSLEKVDELKVQDNRSSFSQGGLNSLEKGPDSDAVGDLLMDSEHLDGADSFDNTKDVALAEGHLVCDTYFGMDTKMGVTMKRRAASPPYVTSQDRGKLFREGFMFRNKPEYDIDGDSVVSVSDSIFSTATDSSKSSAEVPEAVDGFFGVSIRDTRIDSLFSEAIRIMDAEKVERNLVRLLQLYAKDLRLDVKSTFEKGASRLVRRYSASLALRITRCFDGGRSRFREGQELEEITAPLVMDMIDLPEDDDSEDSGVEEVDQFAKVRSFMVGGTPFIKLQDNFQNFVHTVSALSLPLPTKEVRHLLTKTSIQGGSGVQQLKEVFLLREPNSILGLNTSNEAVFFSTFSSVPIQLSTPLVYYLNLFRDYAAGGHPATGAAKWLSLDESKPVFLTAVHQFLTHSQRRDGLPIAKNTSVSYLRYATPGKQLSPEMTTSDPFYSLNVLFTSIALSEMAFLSKMLWECELDLYNARIDESTAVNMLSRKEILDLHMKMLQQNLHSIKNRPISNRTQGSQAGDWNQADAMTQRLQFDFEYLLLRTKDLSARYDQGLSTIIRYTKIKESGKAITHSQRPRTIHKTDGAGKSKCVVSSASEDSLGRPEASRICQKICKRLSTMDRMLVITTAITCVAVVSTAISIGLTISPWSPEPQDVYYSVDSLFSVGPGCYRVLAPSPKRLWASWHSSLQSGCARLSSFVTEPFLKDIIHPIIRITCMTSLARNAIWALLLYLWNSLLSKQMKIMCQKLLAFARLRDIGTTVALSTGALADRLGLIETPLGCGMKRVRWTCRCGRRLYDDFIELRPGAAKEMEHSLNRAMRTRPSHGIQESGQRISLGTRAMSALSGFLGQNTLLATGNGLPQYNLQLQRRNHGSANPSSQSEGRWLLVCAKIGRYATKLSHMDVCTTTSDKDLFTELRKAYIDLRSRWTRLFTLRGIKSIRFVQFELHRKGLVDIRKVPDMPSGERKKEYLYETCELLPPLGENYMMHLFHHPEDGDDESLTCLRVPKKRREKLKVCQQQGIGVGWGLHLVDGWLLNRVWILVLVLFALGSLVFGICWAVVKHDIQGAFGVSAWMLALAMIVVGTVQAQLD